MTSKERHELRYQRRKSDREQKKRKRNEGYTFESVSDFNHLRKSFYQARKSVNWKASVQRYGCNVLENAMMASVSLRSGQNVSKGFIEFDLCERGKKRHITSVHISERVVQKSLCDYGIVPVIQKSLIYDNGASQKGKGTDFARDRLKKHLRQFYRKYGTEGYVITGDCHNFFGSLDHNVVENNLNKMVCDKRLVDLTMQFVHPFKNGLGLGSQVCQILAVSYQNNIDNYIKEVLRCKWYGRYMDDFYIICGTKDEAISILNKVTDMYKDIGIELNERKTHIVKITHGFIWLQDRVYLLPSGKIVNKPGKKNITRNRRKIKKLAMKYRNGEVSLETVRCSYISHMGYLKHKNGYYAGRNITKLYQNVLSRRKKNETPVIKQG